MRKRAWLVVVVMVVLVVLAWFIKMRTTRPLSPGEWAINVDRVLIERGLIKTGNDWSKIFGWWHGSWIEEQITYYRPLVSMLWWVEWRVWGTDWDKWSMVNKWLHLVNALALFAVAAGLFRSRTAGFLSALFFVSTQQAGPTLSWFPAQTDILCGVFYFTSLLLFLYYLDKSKGKSLFLGLSLTSFFLAIASKEMAYSLPALILLTLWFRHQPLRVAWPFFAMAMGMVLVRLISIGSPPEMTMVAPSALSRAILVVLGPLGYPFKPFSQQGTIEMVHLWPWSVGVIMSGWLFALTQCSRLRAPLTVYGSVIFFMGISLLLSALWNEYWAEPFVILWPWGNVGNVAIYALSLLLLWRAAKRELLWVFMCILIVYLPVVQRAGGVSHFFYLPSMGWAMMHALVCYTVYRLFLAGFTKSKTRIILAGWLVVLFLALGPDEPTYIGVKVLTLLFTTGWMLIVGFLVYALYLHKRSITLSPTPT